MSDENKRLKNITAMVYLCQVFAFAFAGIPLLIGVAINLIKRDQVEGTWLESHFNWQIKTVWVALALFAVSGITFVFGLGFYILIFAVLWLVYRITIGWFALNANEPVSEKKYR